MNLLRKMKANPPILLFYLCMVLCWSAMVVAEVLNHGKRAESFVIKLIIFVVVMVAVRFLTAYVMSLGEWEIEHGVEFLMLILVIAGIVLADYATGKGIPYFFELNRNVWELVVVFSTIPIVSYLYSYLNRYRKIGLEEAAFVTVPLMVINVIQVVLTMELPLVYLIYMHMVDCVMLAAFLFRVCPRVAKKGNRLVVWLMYVAWCCVHVACKYDYSVGIMNFFYDGHGWYAYKENVFRLFANAKKFGPAFEGISSIGVSLLRKNANPVHTLTYYYGLVPMALYLLALLVVFVFITWLFVKSRKNTHYHFLCVVAYVNLASRIILGLLFSFGVFSIQMGLPFRNILDWVSVGMLLVAYDTWSEGKKRGFFRTVIHSWYMEYLLELIFEEDVEDDEEEYDEEYDNKFWED